MPRQKKFVVRGTVSTKAGEALKGVTVVAVYKPPRGEKVLGKPATTNAGGKYEITFTEKDLKINGQIITRPKIVIRVYGEEELIFETKPKQITAQESTIDIVIKPPQTTAKNSISGAVTDKAGEPVARVVVNAYRRYLRKETLLGTARTDDEGMYSLEYARPRTKDDINVVIKVTDAKKKELFTTGILFKIPAVADIDICFPFVYPDVNEHDRIIFALKPYLTGNLDIADLEQDKDTDDISFLAGKTGLAADKLIRMGLAFRLKNHSKIMSEFWYAVLALDFYKTDENTSLAALFKNIIGNLPSLDERAIRKAVAVAIRGKVIARPDQATVDKWIGDFLEYVTVQQLSTEVIKTESFIKQVLVEAGVKKASAQKAFTSLLHKHEGFTGEFVGELTGTGALKPAEIADVQTSFELAELTDGDFSVVRSIKKEFAVHTPDAIRSLAGKSRDEWVGMVKKYVTSGDLDMSFTIELPDEVTKPTGLDVNPVERYGRHLARQVQQAYPTAAFAGSLGRALGNGGKPAFNQARKLQKFFATDPEFEILTTPIDGYFKETKKPGMNAFKKDTAFRLELKSIQRIFKLAPSYEAADSLYAAGLHSAQQIYRMGESEFVRLCKTRPGFNEAAARKTWRRAADTHAAAITVITELKDIEYAGMIAALKKGSDAVSNFPNWKNLFQTGDVCLCESGRSVLSPAAYFADLMMFLKDRRAKNPAASVKDIVLKRRPDLGFLELNGDNAYQTLPYIDVVCEVLESAVADGDNDAELTGLTTIPGDPALAKTKVADALKAVGIILQDDYTLLQEGGSNRWVTHDDNISCLLKKKSTANYFVEILRNSKTTADEMRANPQYVNPAAYDKLKAATFPFALPFDMFGDEVRAAFDKAGLKRWELMRDFRGTAAPNNPGDGDIAAEYFGISVDASLATDEKRIIFQADPTHQHKYWGEPNNSTMITQTKNVYTFLQKTGITYNDLLTLLDLKFINPAGDMGIDHLDATCDTEAKEIKALDAVKLDRIHRFLRLWRKLKDWKMWELDLVIRLTAIGNNTLDEAFLVNLMFFDRARRRLGRKVTVEQAAALLGVINTETRFTESYKKREDALYQSLFLNRKRIQPLDKAFAVPLVDVAHSAETITAHKAVVIASLRIKEADLAIFTALTKTDTTAYIQDELTLTNLSFLYRHAWLAKQLKFKALEWQTLLKLHNTDIDVFAAPKDLLDFLEWVEKLRLTGFKPDELNYLLTADRQAKAAVREQDVARFLLTLRQQLQTIAAQYAIDAYPFLQAVPATDAEQMTALLTTLLQQLNRDEATVTAVLDTFRDEVSVVVPVAGLPGGFDFPAAIKDAIGIRYNQTAHTLRFTGLMTTAEQNTLKTDPTLAAVTGLAAYTDAVDELFLRPRLNMKFYEPVFDSALAGLPAAINFVKQLPVELAGKITYEAEERKLRFSGIMTIEEKTVLEALSTDAAYRAALDDLYTRPRTGAFTPDKLWMTDSDLTFPLRNLTDPASDNLAANLAVACTKALAYLAASRTDSAVIQLLSTQLQVTPAVLRALVTRYQLIAPDTILDHLAGAFVASEGAIDYAACKDTFDLYGWLHRVVLILNKLKIDFEELTWLMDYFGPMQLLDFKALPLDTNAAMPPPAMLFRLCSLFRFRERRDESKASMLDILRTLHTGGYADAAAFAADVYRVCEWDAADVTELTGALDLAYPGDYLLAENWERLDRIAAHLRKLNAAASTITAFAAPAMGAPQAGTIKQLFRSKYGAESWLELNTEIQDVLRERKRDALVAWLLTHPRPADAPTEKWENANDVYAYYLLDVEMSSCMLTSRLVQASGSIQLFVQRCMMGLEPDIEVISDGDDGDSAWRWWKWMRKYRVWEANRKVFIYPENWIEPELRRDKSSFFADLENELLQNEVTQSTVETAYLNYLEKLDDVAQLEVAGFYHEDDADRTFIHVFGRTKGAEPHVYYYRQFDYRRWTPWQKVDVDVTGDYLIPAVINKRLFLFWPIFTEVPEEEENSKVDTPSADSEDVAIQPTMKKLRLQMAASQYRDGKWAPKKVSTDTDESHFFSGEIVSKHYTFWAVDRGEIDGRFVIRYTGNCLRKGGLLVAHLSGSFEVFGCKGVPELTDFFGKFYQIQIPDQITYEPPAYMKYVEHPYRSDDPEKDFTFRLNGLLNIIVAKSHSKVNHQVPILTWTPDRFKYAPTWHSSFMDRLLMDIPRNAEKMLMERGTPVGTWMPFFYYDRNRTFFVMPMLTKRAVRYYYPDIKKKLIDQRNNMEGEIRTLVEKFDFKSLPRNVYLNMRAALSQYFNEPLPFGIETFRKLLIRYAMQFAKLHLAALNLQFFTNCTYHFKNDYHPFVCNFSKLVYNPLKGIPALMTRETQSQDTGFRFKNTYQPTYRVLKANTEEYYPGEIVDFTPDGCYSQYNWELFFHIPLMIANRLSQNQRFEEARQWYHYIFNPIGLEGKMADGSNAKAPQKFWITKPFFETTNEEYRRQRIDSILRMLAGDTTADGFTAQLKKDLEDQVTDWRDNPFEPHRIAQYRNVAYQKTTVVKYLDNLISWGDNLFRQDSMESINEATQLYILAAEILGPRPKKIPPQAKPDVETFNELESKLDDFSNALVQVENVIPVMPGNGDAGDDAAPLPMLYFCIPQNDQLLEYWDTVADRLYKIRHCMNIEGVVRSLSLFEPPIDPGALVKAVAGGMDIGSALADMNAPLPYYQFAILLQKANELCGDVKSLGGALLSALEKKDAEDLSLLRQGHEIGLLKAVTAIREKHIDEAVESRDGLKKSKDLAKIKKKYYGDREFMNAGEVVAISLNTASTLLDIPVSLGYIYAGVLKLIPNFIMGASGFGGSPHATGETGGGPFGDAAQLAIQGLGHIARNLDKMAGISSTLASYLRRQEEWDFQKDLADKEIDQLEKQIAAADLRIDIQKKELENHNLQIDNAKSVDEYMKNKFTNRELYQWMVGEVSRVYFQSYQLAYDLAKRAERCYRFELGIQDSDFIQFGYWDSLKKGLLAGEKLQFDLRRLEIAHLEDNRRQFELTKHVSLALLDPYALVQLKETGRCFFTLPEEVFDLDYPGHYFRRIKSVSITLPCIAGPYTTIACTLRLLKNHIRVKTTTGDGYAHHSEDGLWVDDERFVQTNIPVKAIATSTARDDSGVFELSFRDERYLPFEGAGVIGEWALELFNDLDSNNPDPNKPDFGRPLRQFDFDTISDAVIHIKYTARENAGTFKNDAITHLRDYFTEDDTTPGLRMFSLRHMFPAEWYRFVQPENPAAGNVFEFELTGDHFPFKDSGKTLKINSLVMVARCSDPNDYDVEFSELPAAGNPLTMTPMKTYGGSHAVIEDLSGEDVQLDFTAPKKWRFTVTSPTNNNLTPDEISDVVLILGFEWV